MQNPQRAISALGLLVTCMYTGKAKKNVIYPCVRCSYGELNVHPFVLAGKIGDRPSGIYPQPDTTEFPTEDILLIAMERVTVLFDRYAKTQFCILQLLSDFLRTDWSRSIADESTDHRNDPTVAQFVFVFVARGIFRENSIELDVKTFDITVKTN